MRSIWTFTTLIAAGAAVAQANMSEIDSPASELNQILAHPVEVPEGDLEARVIRATIDPRTAAAWHTHPSPVYLYVSQGTLTMEVEGQEPRQISAGEAVAEPLGSPMRVLNEGDEPVEVIVFQLSPLTSEFLEQ